MFKNEAEKTFNQAINVPIWQAKQGYGSFLTFNMGKKVERKKNDGEIFYVGSIRLWIYLCSWKIFKEDKLMATSEDNEIKIATALKFLENERIISIEKENNNIIKIEFSRKNKIIMKGNGYEKDDDFFILFTPIGNIAYNRESGFYKE